MLNPVKIRQWAEGKYPGLIDAHFRGETMFPLEVTRFGRTDPNETAGEIDRQIRQLLDGSVEIVCPDLPAIARPKSRPGYSVALELSRMRRHGEQPLPTRVWFETLDDFLAFLGKKGEWLQLLNDVAALDAAGMASATWARQNARALLVRISAGEGKALALALAALQARPLPDCFAREIALPGISGKFIEERLQLIAEILRDIGSAAWQPGENAHLQLGLRQTRRLLRLMVLDGNRVDYGVSQQSLRQLPAGTDRLLIVENLRTFLTLPPLRGILALYGEGHAVQTLSDLSWMRSVPVHYWGDLDPTGFAILNSLRRICPQVSSVMMDAETLNAHTSLLTSAAKLKKTHFDLLTPNERTAAAFVQDHGQGIEQEKIPTGHAHRILCVHCVSNV